MTSPTRRGKITAATPPTSTAPLRRRTAHHEAAHAIVGRVLGGHLSVTGVRGAMVYPGADRDGHLGVTMFQTNLAAGAELPPAVLWAGAVAEARLVRGPGYGETDVRTALRATGNDDRQALMASADPWLDGVGLDDARAAVKALWEPITKLATTLLAQGRIRDRDVLLALGLDADAPAEDTTHRLHEMRSQTLRLDLPRLS